MVNKSKLEKFIKDIRSRLIESIEETNKVLMDLIEGLFDANLSDDAMKADKIRERFNAWRQKFMYQNPINNIYRKQEEKMLVEKKRFRGIILLLETFLVQGIYIREEVKQCYWLLKNPEEKSDNHETLSEVLDQLVLKIGVFDKNLEFYSKFYKEDLGIDTESVVKEQLLEFFKKKELKRMIRYVKRDNIDKLERKFLDSTDLVKVSKEDLEKEDEIIEDEKEEETQKITKADPKISQIMLSDNPIEIREIKSPYITDKDDKYERINKEITKESIIEDKGEIIEDESDSQEIKDEKESESIILNFFRKVFDLNPYDDEISSWLLQKVHDYQENEKNSEPVLGLYKDLTSEHPEWKISTKKFIKLLKSMVKKGLLAQIEKLDTGYFMVTFQPVGVTKDPMEIINLSKTTSGVLTKNEIISSLKWTDYRAQKTLDYLVNNGIARTDSGFINGRRYYFNVEL